MSTTLTSPFYHFQFHPDSGKFDLLPVAHPACGFHGGQMRLEINHIGARSTYTLDRLEQADAESSLTGVEGPLTILQAGRFFPDSGLKVKVTFALSQSEPLFLWRIQIENDTQETVKIEKIEFLRVGGQEKFGSVDFPPHNSQPRWSFFSNGWQSWSPTGAYLNGEAMRISRLGFLQQPMIINHGTPALRMPGYYTADFFGALADLDSKCGLLAGFLSQKQHFGSIEAVTMDRPSLAMFTSDSALLQAGASIETDWAVITPISTDDLDPFGVYLERVARVHGLTDKNFKPVPSGWCSWYQYYSNLSALDVHKNLDAIHSMRDQLPLQLVQIDDGFETRVGDWFSFKPAFPDGVIPLARDIKDRGFTPGLWLAPFILDPRSDFARRHPEVILRNRRGKPVNAGFGWNNLATGIDLTAPGAMELALEPVRRAVHDWGFPYLKLDFLYAAALPGLRHDPALTRAQVMRQGMEAIRAAVGANTYLVGCGLPLGSGVGLMDAMRIGADVNGSWEPEMKGIRFPFHKEPAMPSARNSLHNTLTRAPLHNRWWTNDPDCLLVRPDSRLSLPEIHALTTAIGMTGGSLLLSDDLTGLPPDRLQMARALLPVIGKRAEVLDLFEQTDPRRLRLPMHGPHGSWTVIAEFNWQDSPQPLTFNPANYHLPNTPCWISSFWDGKIFRSIPGKPLSLPPIPAHGVFLAAVTSIEDDTLPLYFGSSLHFSQGVEVREWEVDGHKASFTLDVGRQAEGRFHLYLPSDPRRVEWDGGELQWDSSGNGIYHFEASLDKPTRINLEYG